MESINETKGQKVEFLSMLLGTLGASLLENMVAGKGVKAMRQGQKATSWRVEEVIWVDEGWGTIRTGWGF